MDSQKLPCIEVLTHGSTTPFADESICPWYSSRRFQIFITTFILAAIIGLIYVFLQPAIYQSDVTLLTVAPTPIDQEIEEINIQHVAIQGNILTGQSLIQSTREILSSLASDDIPDPITLRNMLSVSLVAETNLIKLVAEGENPGFLALLLNTLIDQYQTQRLQQIKTDTAETTNALQQQFELLSEKVDLKRNQIDIFRNQHSILSAGRDENQVSARLNGLTRSLNTAEEAEINTRAKLAAVKKAISRGLPVVPDTDKRSLANLEQRAQELSENLTELDRRYTRQYMSLQPSLRVIPEQLKKLEQKIREQKIDGQNLVLSDAEQDYAAAHQAAIALRNEIEQYKKIATEFTRRFSEHEALVEDLTQLEESYREIQSRLTQIAVTQREKYPQFKVIEPAFQPNTPIRPDYYQNSGIVLALALLLGLLAILLFEFLKNDSRADNPAVARWSRITSNDPSLNIRQDTVDKLEYRNSRAATQMIAQEGVRALTLNELERLLKASSSKGQVVMTALLQGLSVREISELSKVKINTTESNFNVPGSPSRQLPISKKMAELIDNNIDFDITESEAISLINCAAFDAKIIDSSCVSAESIRYSYINFLIRQGIKLVDLEKVIGALPIQVVTEYTQLADKASQKKITEINLVHPLLAS
ncbi:GumC family protein [Neptunomonas antarctica]|uniref:Uncharacterized protein involved in exopolysaccharide biosynthesis n=1 Tax=Neptunomonas antarctica TaxID=619304 RepID=A0A1N7LIX2_9GAMM|nr:hypothetical protein [Neptunomonas antarctica]SIS73808.1 Uncharacterized protein involved in exopolysaccharide biosynthesis [Neptunomonas antarctica]